MKLKIRAGLFETNSSSMHSLSFNNSKFNTYVNEELNELDLGIGEYGWGYQELKEPLEKMDYLAIEAFDEGDKKRRLLEAIHRLYPHITINFHDDGYIDHQSMDKIWSELDTVDDIYKVIFGKSKIIIDNDNGDYYGF